MLVDNALRLKFDIYKVLKELAKTKPLFCSELEFQFYLAWAIKELYGDEYKICIEYPLKNYDGKNRNIDLVLVDSLGFLIPIELKYKTSKIKQLYDGVTYDLKDQSANNLTKYGHWKDISRIEYFRDVGDKFLVGYVITLTNQHCTWQNISNPEKNDYEFALADESFVAGGVKNWTDKTCENFKNKYPAITIKSDYFLKWHEYSNFDNRNGLFKCLVTEIRKCSN